MSGEPPLIEPPVIEPPVIEPDTKDWTWVLREPCPECGFDASAHPAAGIASSLEATLKPWSEVLAAASATARPRPDVWSPTEYACHVRDVHRIFAARLEQMLARDDPTFANWDQDETAAADRYDLQDPVEVSRELAEATADVAARYALVEADQWTRPGHRSNGSAFTVETLGLYHLHDVIHHLWDVGRGGAAGRLG